jgi:hypothetical protein
MRVSDLSYGYAGKLDAATSCPSGLEGAGRKRTSAMMQRAALLPYTRNCTNATWSPGVRGMGGQGSQLV